MAGSIEGRPMPFGKRKKKDVPEEEELKQDDDDDDDLEEAAKAFSATKMEVVTGTLHRALGRRMRWVVIDNEGTVIEDAPTKKRAVALADFANATNYDGSYELAVRFDKIERERSMKKRPAWGMEEAAKVMSYTALVLDKASRDKLVSRFKDDIPEGWEVIAHHMTINMGDADGGPAENMVGDEAPLTVKTFAKDDLVMAVGVVSPVPSKNDIKHVTLAVNRKEGGKPFFSNKLKDWNSVTRPLVLKGKVEEV